MIDQTLIPPERGSFRVAYPLETRSLADLGDLLPHGVVDGGEPLRTYSLERPTMGLQKRVGGLRQNPAVAKRPAGLIVRLLSTVMSGLGSRRMLELGESRADELIGRLTIGDVLFLGFGWQRARHPRGLPLGDVDCGSCGRPLKDVRVDLATLEVTVIPEDRDLLKDPPRAIVRLWDPLPRPNGGAPIELLEVRSPAWGAAFGRMAAGAFGKNQPLMQARTFAAGIAGAQAGADFLAGVPEALLDELGPDDVRLIDEALQAVTPTLDLGIEVACPSCHALNRTSLDWQSEGFFSAS